MAERSSGDPSPIGAWLFVTFQRLLPQRTLSRCAHRLARSRSRLVKDALIGAFVRGFEPRMSEAAMPDPHRYPSFAEFFTRRLRADARRVDPDPHVLTSPVDGSVSQIGELDGERLLQAKGRSYELGALLAGEPEWTRRLAGGGFATLYLAPRDYHRIHMPLAGQLRAAWFVPGRLFSVNATTTAAVAGLFARNERVILAFESPAGLPFAVVLVGALLVGSIATVWHGEVAPGGRSARALPLPVSAGALEKGAELGWFNMGSTVIVLLPRAGARWAAHLAPGSEVRVGQALGRLEPAP
ncbi:MAG TPA: archaetidylserine decarboxylase [Steroidobacteraceae bacterium]|nr:archaetidylserine decarboxylase [Steroidobacteraceae bacterium]